MTILAVSSSTGLWYLTRATGAVALLLLTVSVAMGIANVARIATRMWPRFVVEAVHRNVALLAVAFLLVHIVSSVLDPFAPITLLDTIIPFASRYRPLWLGFGTAAFDLIVAVALTSMIRLRLGFRSWRAVHWLSYVSWPIAVLHGLGTGSDTKQSWMLLFTAACGLVVLAAVALRIALSWPAHPRAAGSAALVTVTLPVALVMWLPSGPLGSDWARRSGTPASLLASSATSQSTGSASSGARVASFSASVSGTTTQQTQPNGLQAVTISLGFAHSGLSTMIVRIVGSSTSSGGVQMSSSSVTLGDAADPQRFSGTVTGLSGTSVNASLSAADGEKVQVALTLTIATSGATSGTLALTATTQ